MRDIVAALRNEAKIRHPDNVVRVALESAADEIERLRVSLRALVYEQDGRWFCGIKGDSEVTEIVGSLLKD